MIYGSSDAFNARHWLHSRAWASPLSVANATTCPPLVAYHRDQCVRKEKRNVSQVHFNGQPFPLSLDTCRKMDSRGKNRELLYFYVVALNIVEWRSSRSIYSLVERLLRSTSDSRLIRSYFYIVIFDLDDNVQLVTRWWLCSIWT